ncbi:hypothetical protein GH722_08580 [Alphaproteobacteria bacterium HT1-32]|nr:hypothetical protein [Alphaproteobacteria bacterium HT1-32]
MLFRTRSENDSDKSGTPQDRMSSILLCLLMLAMVTIIASLFLVRELGDASRQIETLRKFQADVYFRLGAYEEMQHHLGYTQFIHNFKNGVLRRDADRLLMARLQINKALLALEKVGGGVDDMAAIRNTLEAYREMTFIAERLIVAGRSAIAIDRVVRIDDGPAMAAMGSILAGIHAAREALEENLKEQNFQMSRIRMVFHFAVGGLVLLTVVILFVYVRARQNARILAVTAASLQSANTYIEERIERLVGMAKSSGPGEVFTRHAWPEGMSAYEALGRLEASLTELIHRMGRQEDRLIAHSTALETANEELAQFNSVVSHDLQEPLRKILTNIDLIRLRHRDEVSDDLGRHLDKLAISARKMRRLIVDLLAYSRVGSEPLSQEMLDLREVVQAAVRETEHLFDDRSGSVSLDIPDGPPVPGDRFQLVQAFVNILSNAAKFVREGVSPEVRISGVYTDYRFTLTFADNGVGFDPALAEQIFEPFRRFHSGSEYEGSGIGLSIVKRAVTRQGGNVRATPAETGGTRFIVNLMLQSQEAAGDSHHVA